MIDQEPLLHETLQIRRARTHNLVNLDLTLPHQRLVVITGPSGCGKSSLAIDTIVAESQRQYLERLSVGSRQFLQQLPRPQVDAVTGLLPTVAIDQRRSATNPRSTVGTLTEIYDYLRILMARLADPVCPECGLAICQQAPQQIIDQVAALAAGTKVILFAPLVQGKTGAHHDVLATIRKAGFVRVRVDGTTFELDQVPELEPHKSYTIEAVVDRLVIREGIVPRLTESLFLALKHGEGVVRVSQLLSDAPPDGWTERLFSTLFVCPACQISFLEIEPRTFSFNSPYGACPTCAGLGTVTLEGAVQTCPACEGARLRPEALSCRLADSSIREIVELPLTQLQTFLSGLAFSPEQQPIAEPLVGPMLHRLRYLQQVGLGYLTLARGADTLSGGEFQRVRLAASIGSGLLGVCYVLDEPSVGLHPRDQSRLIGCLRDLQRLGNSVFVVEHEEAIMRAADHLIELGPGAGPRGGTLVAQGTPAEVAAESRSLTGRYLSGKLTIAVPPQRRAAKPGAEIVLRGARGNNLKRVDLRLPLGVLVAVTGVSGSGKSTLINETLVPALAQSLGLVTQPPLAFDEIQGANAIRRLIEIDQTPLGTNPRSNPATATGVFDEIRKVFAHTKQSRARGFRSGRFSFNSGDGRCDVCKGLGMQRLQMGFLPEMEVPCPRCLGKRFNPQTLVVRFKGHSIAEVLDLSIDQGAELFAAFPNILRPLTCLRQVGLGYLKLGQSATTLSGGEAQRIKLAAELAKPAAAGTLYILDEPTSGLHRDDIAKLLGLLHELVDGGNSVLVIEHQLDVMRSADWIIDLGPEGGEGGGEILAVGTPEQVAGVPRSFTGQALSK